MGFLEYLQIPDLKTRYSKIKKYFNIRESAYDVTSTCQLRCEGCYYFQGDKYQVKDNSDEAAWRAFLSSERARGINFVNLAGAEPALVPHILRAAYETIPTGTIFTNGLKRIAPEIRYRIHISVWGDPTHDPVYRRRLGGQPGPNCLDAQLRNYRGDDRVIFVYTFNGPNVSQVDEVLDAVTDAGHVMTFNVFSPPVSVNTTLTPANHLERIYEKMLWAMERYGDRVIYSEYNARVHTSAKSLHALFGCPYPRATRLSGNPLSTGISATFRSYRTDLTHRVETDCCVPDTECAQCRHYAAGSAIVSSKLQRHVDSEQSFRGWLDYVDTYLAIWVLGYRQGSRLYVDSPPPAPAAS
jgi:hypothetical protein